MQVIPVRFECDIHLLLMGVAAHFTHSATVLAVVLESGEYRTAAECKL